jgi:threonylcarbamoyladenosine tRNA methylthiotransferase MtaB
MKVHLDMVGCRLNQSEIESMGSKIRQYEHQIIGTATDADLVIINTCCVTAKAAADSRKMIRHAIAEGVKQVVITGCWATLFADEANALQGVTQVFDNSQKSELVETILGSTKEQKASFQFQREPLPGERHRTRAFIKVQEGCDDHCTFCLTRLARGRSRSIPLDEVKQNILSALNGGTKEIVLTGVQLGAYGRELKPERNLVKLIQDTLSLAPTFRVRLSSLEPWDVTDELIGLWQNSRLCRHLHIPLQSGSDHILQRMGRKITSGEYSDLIEKIKQNIPEIAITTDVIVGFPGESEEDFQCTSNQIKTIGLAGGHVFTYSAMKGTAAERFSGQVLNSVRQKRNHITRQLLHECTSAFLQIAINKQYSVLWEKTEQKHGCYELSGFSDNYMRIIARSGEMLQNKISLVHITGINENGDCLLGSISA